MERLTDNMLKMAEKSCFTRKPRFNKNENPGFHLVILFLIIIIAFVDYFVKPVGVVAHNTIGTD